MKPITTIKNYVAAAILALIINNGDTLWATTDHPFFNNGKYIAAQELNPGDQFSTYDGSNLFLKEKLSKDTSNQVYNLTVADNANYYVGRNPILVHNSCFLNHLDNYPTLKAAINDLDEGLKGEFIKDFFKTGSDVLDKQNKNPGMLRAWDIFKKSTDVRISTLATEISSLEKFTDIVKSNNLGLEESSLGALLNAKTKVKNCLGNIRKLFLMQ